MRAVVMETFGGPEVLRVRHVEDPIPGTGQVLVAVQFASITFVETQFRASGKGPFKAALPMIPGNGIGGVVTSVGAEADAGLVNKRVISSTGGSGGYAERAAVDADGLFVVPEGLALDSATALLADGRTAMMLIQAAGIREGERVLVEAAAGGVGTLLVQLARAVGSTVIAVAGSARKVELARGLGADAAIDYRESDWTERVREAVGAVDVVFDGVGGGIARSAFALLDRGGRMLRFGMASGEWAEISDVAVAERGVTMVGIPRLTAEETRAFTARALAAAAAGALRPMIGQRFPLERAADAHAAMASRATVGKTLLEVR